MDLEKKIKQLKEKLMIKKAYLSVEIKFPRGNSIPEEIKEKIITELKTACTQLAEDQEMSINKTSLESPDFDADEVSILKQLAASVKAKTAKTELPEEITESKKPEPQLGGAKARILMLDSIDKTLRNKIEPQSIVRIKGSNDGKHFVETLDGHARRFWINTDDLDFNID